VDGLRAAADAVGLAVVPLPIVSAQDIPGRLTAPEPVCDLLLIIPDEKLGSTKIVAYIIKEALRRKLPVVGYNSWFARNGAVLSFVVDYKGVGRQTAALARRLLSGAAVPAATILPPEAVAVSVDLKTAEKIGVHLSAEIIGTAGEVQR